MSYRCDKCGSPNHSAHDCHKPYNGWKEREPALPVKESPASPEPRPTPKTAPSATQGAASTVKSVALDPPRWPGGPPVCPEANLPAFGDEQAAGKFFDSACGKYGRGVDKLWKCAECGHWHFLAKAVGDDAVSGPLPKRSGGGSPFPFVRKEHWELERRRGAKRETADLPRQERKAKVSLPKKDKEALLC